MGLILYPQVCGAWDIAMGDYQLSQPLLPKGPEKQQIMFTAAFQTSGTFLLLWQLRT